MSAAPAGRPPAAQSRSESTSPTSPSERGRSLGSALRRLRTALRRLLPFRRVPRPADGTMALRDHLMELRRRVFLAALGLFVGTVIGFVWFAHGPWFLGLRSLGDILTAPYCSVPAEYRVGLGSTGTECRLLATGPFSAVEFRLKAALLAGAVLSAPVWLGQLWGFVTPGLYVQERRYARVFAGVGALLFAGGAVLAYVVVGEGLTVLLGFGGDTTVSALTPESYFTFIISMLLIFGVSFELPLLLILLNRVGVVTGAALARARRYAIFGLVVFAGLVVPGNDPITMGALAVALSVLYEVAVQVARLHDRAVARRVARAALHDDEPSALEDVDAGVGAGTGRP